MTVSFGLKSQIFITAGNATLAYGLKIKPIQAKKPEFFIVH
jgi:hypothetical protein